jgi:hypothetical protein
MPRIYKTDQKDKERREEGKLSNIFTEKSWIPIYNLQGKSERTKETISRIGSRKGRLPIYRKLGRNTSLRQTREVIV